jgi:hypothetical protein
MLKSLFRYVPMFVPILAIYSIFIPFGVNFNEPVKVDFLSFTLPSGAMLDVTMNELFLILVALILFFEIVKAAAVTPGSSWIEHMLSTLVFVAFLVMFLVVEPCGNATFLIITVMSLIDVLAGWTISYRAALRDFGGMVGPGMHPT